MTYKEMLRFELGNRKNEPLVFLHGIFVPLEIYIPFIKELANQDYYVIAPMLHPRRDDEFKPGTIDEYADKFLEFSEERNLSDYPVVAHSFGSSVAFEAATRYDEINKIVAISPTQPTEDNLFDFTRKSLIANYKGTTANFENKLQYPLSSFWNFINAPKQFVQVSGEMIDYQFPEKVEQPTLFLLPGEDDYYPLISKDRQKSVMDYIRESFSEWKVKILSDEVHGYPTFKPKDAAVEVIDYLNK